MPRKRIPKSRVHPDVYAGHLERLGISQVGNGAIFGVSPRTAQRWAASGPPVAVVACMARSKTVDALRELVEEARNG